MKVIQFQIPDDLDLKEYDAAMILASKLYQDARLSAGQAAAMVGISKKAFLEVLGSYGVSIFSAKLEDLHADIKNA